jgi:hypothetical protein
MRFAFALVLLASTPSTFAQEPPPGIGPYVVDIHATVPRFPNDSAQLAESRGLVDASGSAILADLPGTGLGVQIGAHVYPLKWRAVTFGIGGEFTSNRATETPPEGVFGLVSTTESFQSIAPQLSFNFGTGNGWSYISGGVGVSTWSLVAEGQAPFPSDSERLKTINYGGGARWFMKSHLAFSFDVRFYAINPGTPYFGFPGSPRTTLVIVGAGVSMK